MSFVEIDIFGVYVAPIVPLMVAAWLIFVVLRRILWARGLLRRLWHPPLFDVSLYGIVLAGLVLALAAWGAHV